MPGAGRRGLLAPSPEWLVPGSSKGVVSSSPWGPPYELRPLPARLTGAKARGLSATRCPGPILLKSPGEGGGGRREELLPSAASAVPLAAAGFARPEGAAAATASRTHESRGEERTHAGSRRPQARPAPRPPRLAALTLAAGRSRGASARVASLPARTRPECGVVIVTLRSGGASRRSRSRCGSRCPRLGRAGCRPGGALTSPPCSAPLLPPPSPLHFLCLWSHLLLGEGACAAGRPDSSPAAPPPRLRLPLPPPRVCTTAEARRANAGRPGLGVEIKQTMTFPFPARLSQVKTHLKTTSVISDPAPHPTPGSAFKCPVSGFSSRISFSFYL